MVLSKGDQHIYLPSLKELEVTWPHYSILILPLLPHVNVHLVVQLHPLQDLLLLSIFHRRPVIIQVPLPNNHHLVSSNHLHLEPIYGSLLMDVGPLLHRNLPNNHHLLHPHHVLQRHLRIILLPRYGDQLGL